MANTKVTGDLIASSTIATGNIADNAVTSDKISGITTAHIAEGSNLYYTDARADARVALIVDSAPATLDTLNELAAALGDDPNFATTTANSIGTKLPLAGGTLTGGLTGTTAGFSGSITASGNSNSFGNTTIAALSASTGTFSASVTAAGNSNSFGATTFAGAISGSGIELSNYMQIKVDDAEIYWTNTANNDYWRWKRDASNNFICDHYNGSSTTAALSFDSSQNATFAGNLNISSPGDLYINSGTSYNNKGSIFMSNQRTEIVSDIVNATANGDTSLNFKTRSAGATASAMFIDEFRRVGIGTASPTRTLDVFAANNFDGIALTDSADTLWNILKSGSSVNTSYFNMFSQGVTKVRIHADNVSYFNGGNVGIGTTSPTEKLQINPNDGGDTRNIKTFFNTSGVYNPASEGTEEKVVSGLKFGWYSDYYQIGATRGGGTDVADFLISDTGQERLIIKANGNVGIGTTSPNRQFSIYGTNDGYMSFDGGRTGNHEFVVGSDTAGFIIYDDTLDTYRFVIDQDSGNVGIGITSPNTTLHIDAGQNAGILTNNVAACIGGGFVTNDLYHREGGLLLISGTNATQTSAGIAFQTRNTGNTNYWKSSILMNRNGELEFYTGGAGTGQGSKRMFITSGGNLELTDGLTQLTRGSNGGQIALLTHSGTVPYGMQVRYTGASPNTTDNYFFLGSDSAANRIIIWGNGNIQNSNNSYGAISDEKLKENIVDATPKLDDLMKVKVRNYNLIGNDKKQIGVIAQELEEVFPAMIDESIDFENKEVTDEEGNVSTEKIDLGTTTKSVKYSVFVPMLIKAIQELKAEIETLKTQINN